jgi:hypothetical protein
MPRGAPEKAPDIAGKAVCARHEDRLADAETGVGPGLDHLAGRFIAGHQRIAHAGKGRHRAGPEEFLRAGGDAGMRDLDHKILRTGRRQPQGL